MRASGWTLRVDPTPVPRRCVIIGAPHTSNWDFVLTLLVGAQLDLDFYWVGKKSLFEPPIGGLMRRLGGIPVDRGGRHNYVDQLADRMRSAARMALVIAPEGTRSRSNYWKSGFYYIARAAGVPIVLGFVDYGRRRAGLGPILDPARPRDEVMAQIARFYSDKKGLFPNDFTPPKLRNR